MERSLILLPPLWSGTDELVVHQEAGSSIDAMVEFGEESGPGYFAAVDGSGRLQVTTLLILASESLLRILQDTCKAWPVKKFGLEIFVG